jgi:hypothetical protein
MNKIEIKFQKGIDFFKKRSIKPEFQKNTEKKGKNQKKIRKKCNAKKEMVLKKAAK